MNTLHIPSLAALPAAASDFADRTQEHTVIAFRGAMGAGKTTFISALCEQLGVASDAVNSPTFAIVNEYRADTTGELIYHFDFYRLEKAEEAVDLGFEDYFYSGALCLIEWPDLVADLLPGDALFVTIAEDADGGRTLSWD